MPRLRLKFRISSASFGSLHSNTKIQLVKGLAAGTRGAPLPFT